MTFCMSFLSVHLATYCALVLKKKKKERQKDDNDDAKAKDGAMKMDDHADDHNPKFYYKKDGTKLLRSLTPSLPTSSCYYVSSCKSKG